MAVHRSGLLNVPPEYAHPQPRVRQLSREHLRLTLERRGVSAQQERIDKLRWLKAGEVVLVKGEVTDRGSVYVHQVEQLSASGRASEDVDGFFQRMAAETQADQRRDQRR
jgi:hypothetical protein